MMRRFFYYSFRILYFINRWIRRRFTKAGLLVLGGLLASAVVGIDTKQTVAYQIFTLLLALVVVAMIWSLFFRVKFEVSRVLPRFGTVNEKLVYRLEIQNKTPKRQAGLQVMEKLEASLPTFNEFLHATEPDEAYRNRFDRFIGYYRWAWLVAKKQGATIRAHRMPTLAPSGREQLPLEMLPSKRGRLNLDGITVVRPDPLGIFKSMVTIPARQSVLVLPRRYTLPPVDLPGSRKYQSGGVALASSVGDSEEFVSLRDYRPGDPLRRIHWRSWAKTGKPVVKEYQDEFFVRHALILDTFQASVSSPSFEEAVSVAASFAYSIQTQESLLDLMFVGASAYCFTSGRGLAHTDKMLAILASVKACTDKPFSVLPPSVFGRAAMLSSCICILLCWDDERKHFIERLKAMGVPVMALVVTDAADTDTVDTVPGTDPLTGRPADADAHVLTVGSIQEDLASL